LRARTFSVRSPIGLLEAAFTEKGLSSLSLVRKGFDEVMPQSGPLRQGTPSELITALSGYFHGDKGPFSSIELDTTALTPFRRSVLMELRNVPFGDIVTYGELGERVGRPAASRAVGGAVGANPYLLVVPCHRVLGTGSGGKYTLTGFGAGLDVKRWLLRHEGHSDDVLDL